MSHSSRSRPFLNTLLLLLIAPCSPADPIDIPSDTPISSLLSSAKAARSRGAHSEALLYFDAAANRDPSDYLTLFQRGATQLSLGRTTQACSDFDKVLQLKPGFEGAHIQRGKIRARNGDWPAAKEDFVIVGGKAVQELADLEEAEGASYLAIEAEKKGDWETCISQAGTAIMTAGLSLPLRQLRVRCRLERGEVQEAVSDLGHVLQMRPGMLEPHLQISSMLFYSLNDAERGIAQIRKCLHSDPDSKPCKALLRREKAVSKSVEQINALMSKRQFNSATKVLVGSGTEDDQGLLQDVQNDVKSGQESGIIHKAAPNTLYAVLVEKTCECYYEMKSKKATQYCDEALTLVQDSLHALLHKAQKQVDAENYEAAIAALNTANEAHPGNQVVQQKLQDAQIALKRSKQKDYYKVLGVSKEADDRTIKKAYRTLTKINHPDKATARGVTKEDAEKKMAAINEAYEVLSNPELKAQFDRGEDPNDPMARQGGNPFQGSPFGGGQQFVFQQGGGGQHFKFQGGGGGGGGMPFGFPFG